jgi:hypothetical protein
LANGHNQSIVHPAGQTMNMAFGQNGESRFRSWGGAPGYGDDWPSAKESRGEKKNG